MNMYQSLQDRIKTFLASKSTTETIFLFVGAGLVVALFQYLSFYVLFSIANIEYLVSSGLSFCMTIVVSFFVQKHITFYNTESCDHTHTVFILTLFSLNALFGLCLNMAIMYIGVDMLALSPYLVQVVSMAILASYNFFVYRRLLG